MRKLNVKYLGLTLDNPIIVTSSPFTSNIDSLLQCEKAGAGAVVLKSIFEEQILGETEFLSQNNDYPEMHDYLERYVGKDYVDKYIALIQDAKAQLTIPVIASINCNTNGKWISYAKKAEAAGADAIEINIIILPTQAQMSAEQIEKHYFDIISNIVSQVNIPVSVKLYDKFTNILNVTQGLYNRGAKGVVMFNRILEPDINIETRTITTAQSISRSEEVSSTLRSVAFCYNEVDNIDISVSKGVHTGEDVVKALLVGANCVGVCSAITYNGFEVIKEMKDFVENWMTRNSHDSISQFCGSLSHKYNESNKKLERVQYIKYFSQQL